MNAALLMTSCLLWLTLTKRWKVTKTRIKDNRKAGCKTFLASLTAWHFTFPKRLTNAADGRCLVTAKAKRKGKIENRFLRQKHKQHWIQTCRKPQDGNPVAYWARTFDALILWPAGSTNRSHLTFLDVWRHKGGHGYSFLRKATADWLQEA